MMSEFERWQVEWKENVEIKRQILKFINFY